MLQHCILSCCGKHEARRRTATVPPHPATVPPAPATAPPAPATVPLPRATLPPLPSTPLLPRSTLPPRRSTVPRPRSTAPPPRHIPQPPQATLLRLHPTHQLLPSMTVTRKKKRRRVSRRARRNKDAKLLMACEASIYEATLILSEYVIMILFNLVDKICVSFYSSGMMKPVNILNYH